MFKRLCLEIGSGHNPMPQADVLLDKYLDYNGERGGPLKIDQRPMVVGDACQLPFKDGVFDYVICRHVLEHLIQPEKALREMMRVGKAGYIETPSEIAEWLEPHRPYHRWFVRCVPNKLLLTPRGSPFHWPFTKVFHQLWRNNFSYRLFYATNPDLFLVRYEWRGEIRWSIVDRFDKPLDEVLDFRQTLGQLINEVFQKLFAKGKSLYYQQMLKFKSPTDIWSLVACPICHGDVMREENFVICKKCGRHFPIRNGIPIMLIEEAQIP